jgi:hypothetical protein
MRKGEIFRPAEQPQVLEGVSGGESSEVWGGMGRLGAIEVRGQDLNTPEFLGAELS